MGDIDDIPRLSGKEATILDILIGRGELYGLGIVDASEGKIKQGTLYVTLHRMEEKGYVESRKAKQVAGAFGPARRLYKPTGHGARVYKLWSEMAAAAVLERALT